MSDKTPSEKAARKQAREFKKYLGALTATVQRAIAAIDAEMLKPHSVERGKRIAGITNALELQNDMALRFVLGKTKPRKRRPLPVHSFLK